MCKDTPQQFSTKILFPHHYQNTKIHTFFIPTSFFLKKFSFIFIYMNTFAESLIKMIDSGDDILDIAKYFGGTQKLLNTSKKYPYLYAMLETKLSGSLYCSAEGDDGEMIPFELPFVLIDLEDVDIDDDMSHYNASVDIIIPEIKKIPAFMRMLYCWFYDYLSDMGAEVGSFNDSKLNQKMIWIYVESVNGNKFDQRHLDNVTDEEVLGIIPTNYKRD